MAGNTALKSGNTNVNVKTYKVGNAAKMQSLHDLSVTYAKENYTVLENEDQIDFTGEEVSLEDLKKEAQERLKQQELEREKEKEKKTPWYKVAFDYAATAIGSVTCGALDVLENIGDGVVMAGCAIASGVATLTGNDEVAKSIKDWGQQWVSYDITEELYDATMNALGVDEEIAHGFVHTAGTMVGTVAGYVALTALTGGTATVALSGAAAAGSAAENAFKNGANFDEAAMVSALAAGAGAVSGGLLDRIGGGAAGAMTLKEVLIASGKGALAAMSEPVVNSFGEYAIYGRDMVDENGNPIYDNFWDYYTGSGGLMNTLIAGEVGGVSTGLKSYEGYRQNSKKQSTSNEGSNDYVEITLFSDTDSTLDVFGQNSNGFDSDLDTTLDIFGKRTDSQTSTSRLDPKLEQRVQRQQRLQEILDFKDRTSSLTSEEMKEIVADAKRGSFDYARGQDVIRKYLTEVLHLDLDNLPDEVLNAEMLRMPYSARAMASSTGQKYVIRQISVADIVGSASDARVSGTYLSEFLKGDRRFQFYTAKHFDSDMLDYFLKSYPDANVGKALSSVDSLADNVLYCKVGGKYYVYDGGNHRTTFLKLQYLSELSRATSPEDIARVNRKYTINVPVLEVE